jgi:Ca-activated chloride channel homolog
VPPPNIINIILFYSVLVHMLDDKVFAHPEFFWLLLLPVAYVGWYIWKERQVQASLQVSDTSVFAGMGNSYKYYLRHLPMVLKAIAASLLIAVLARPQSTNRWEDTAVEGIDIVLGIDISGSMMARDLKPDRLEAAKAVAQTFIQSRPNDRIGLVTFSGESFTQCPLTTDHSVLVNLLRDIKSGMLKDGTAIGEGLATAVARLKDSEAKSRVIILLTDGVNNSGAIAPLTASEIAETFGIRVYTIGAGSRGMAPYPVQTPFGMQLQNMEVEIDEEVLGNIAQMTGGQYFRATDNESLQQIYQEIDKLEKSKISVTEFSKRKEEYYVLAFSAALLLIGDVFLRTTILRTIP